MAKLKVKRSDVTSHLPVQPATKSPLWLVIGIVGWLTLILACAGLVAAIVYGRGLSAQQSANLAAERTVLTERYTAETETVRTQNAELEQVLKELKLEAKAARRDAQVAERNSTQARAQEAARNRAAAPAIPVAETAGGYGDAAIPHLQDSPYDSEWGRYPDLRLKLARIDDETTKLNEQLAQAKAAADLKARQLNKHMIRMDPKSRPDGDIRRFSVDMRNTLSDREANLVLYHIVYFTAANGRYYIYKNERIPVTIPPKTDKKIAPKPWLQYRYSGFVVLLYDDTGQLLDTWTSDPPFRRNAEALLDVQEGTMLDADAYPREVKDTLRDQLIIPPLTRQKLRDAILDD